VDLDGFLERTASGDGFGRDSSWAGGWAGGKQQPARCSRKTQDKFAIASMAKKFLHRCMGVHSRVHVHFLRGVWYTSTRTGVLSTMHVQVFMLNRCYVHQRIYIRTRSLQDVLMRSCMCSLFI